MFTLPSFQRRVFSMLACAAALAAGARADDASVRTAIAAELQSPALAHSWTGVLVKSLRDGRTVFAQNDDKLFIPASNNKLLVSSTCNDVLPPDFHYTTRVLRDGDVQSGTLRGSLYIKGGGDPTLITDDLVRMAKAVKDAGITHVTGDIVGDGSIFDNDRVGSGWAWDDLSDDYSGEIDGLTVDHSAVYWHVKPRDVGQTPTVSLDQDPGYLLIRNVATTVADSDPEGIHVNRQLGSNVVVVSGAVRRGDGDITSAVTFDEPAVYVAYLFRSLLRSEGVVVDGTPRRDITPAAAVQVTYHDSPPLPEILSLLLQPSDNLIAEMLLKTLGVVKRNEGSTDAGIAVEREFLARVGVDKTGWQIVDGSGLSRQNLVQPDSIAKVLAYDWNSPHKDAYLNALPLSGKDVYGPRSYYHSSLRRRMVGTPAEGNLHAKTGYVSNVLSLSGFVTSKDGEPLVFSMLMNHFISSNEDIRGVQDRIGIILASSNLGPGAAVAGQ